MHQHISDADEFYFSSFLVFLLSGLCADDAQFAIRAFGFRAHTSYLCNVYHFFKNIWLQSPD